MRNGFISSLVVLHRSSTRRLDTEPIALLATVRDGYPISLEEERLPRLRLERLGANEAAELLHRHAPGLHPIRRAGLLAAAAGNPLALVELADTSRRLIGRSTFRRSRRS